MTNLPPALPPGALPAVTPEEGPMKSGGPVADTFSRTPLALALSGRSGSHSFASLEEPSPKTRAPMAIGLLGLAVAIGVGIGLGGSVTMSEAAVAPGVMRAEGHRRTVQHLEGGIIQEILVKDGDRVEHGQLLVRLVQVRSEADAAAAAASLYSEMARAARLEAELAGATKVTFPADLLASEEPRAVSAVREQQALLDARTASLQSQIAVIAARHDQARADAESARAQLLPTRQKKTLLRNEERTTSFLVSQGLTQLTRLYALQREVAAADGSLEELDGRIKRGEASMAEADSQMRQIRDKQTSDVATELRDAMQKLAEAQERLRAAQDVVGRHEVRAEVSGTVVNLRYHNLGAVVRPGEAILDIAPSTERLIAEIKIRTYDIDIVQPGQPVDVHLSAFKSRLPEKIDGRLALVGSDITVDEKTGESYFRGEVAIEDSGPAARMLAAGMPVEAHVITGHRSFLHYLAQPVLDSLASAMGKADR